MVEVKETFTAGYDAMEKIKVYIGEVRLCCWQSIGP